MALAEAIAWAQEGTHQTLGQYTKHGLCLLRQNQRESRQDLDSSKNE